jgi:hypothetical protein
MSDERAEKPVPTRQQVIARMWELASMPSDRTKGNFGGQIGACKWLYEKVEFAPAIHRLKEIAEIDPSETGGRQTDQKAAAKALKEIVTSIKPDTTGIQ